MKSHVHSGAIAVALAAAGWLAAPVAQAALGQHVDSVSTDATHLAAISHASIVHGPFTAARLFHLAARQGGTVRQFGFRALAPLFVDQPVALVRAEEGNVAAIRCDGVTAMTATFKYQIQA